MMDNEFKLYANKSILCWLATSNSQNEPNVSPKEIFTLVDNKTLLIANIASPNSIQNIAANPNVCVSFLDIFVQKGYKVKGLAKIIDKNDSYYEKKRKILTDLFTDKFTIISIIEIEINQVSKVMAPSYWLFPETTETSQIESAMKTYKVMPSE